MKIPTILASTALAVALFGATPLGHAAGRMILPKNSVGAAQLKKAAVTGAKVKDGSLMAADFQAGQLPQGPKGDKGDPGAKGDAGAQGAPGLSGYELVASPQTPIAANTTALVTATCPAGKMAVGGGGVTSTGGEVKGFAPVGGGAQWGIQIRNPGAGSVVAVAIATCAKVAP